MAPQLREAWRTKYLGVPNFEATGISKAIERLSHSLSCQAECTIARSIARSPAHIILIHVYGSPGFGILKLYSSYQSDNICWLLLNSAYKNKWWAAVC